MKKAKDTVKPKQIVYLLGAGATQAEAHCQSIEPVILGMRNSEEFGKEGVSSRILRRANIDRRLDIKEETDIEKLISLLAASGLEHYRNEAEKLRRSYYEEILESLNEAKILNNPLLAVGLLEMHNDKIFQEVERLSGIISLNHDNLFQVASQTVHKSVNLGFEFTSDYFDEKHGSKAPLILQMHGSFNWLNERPIKVLKLTINNEYKDDILWIPPSITKEATDYPYNKLMGLAHELLVSKCDVLRIIGCSLSQNDWNLISLLFNTQYNQLKNKRTCYKIELIMSNKTCKRIIREYSYLKNIIPIPEIKDIISKKEDFEEENIPLNSEIRNPFKYWLKAKARLHKSKKQFTTKIIGKSLKQILEG